MTAFLEIHDGSERRIPLAEDAEVLVGRSPDCTIVIADPSVSRRHARLRRGDGGFVIEDLGSANGTTVNGDPVDGPVRLKDDDRLTLGAITITFRDEPSSQPAEGATMMFRVAGPAARPAPSAEPSENPPTFTTTSAAVPPPAPSIAPQPQLSSAPAPITTTERARRMTATTALPRESGRDPGLLELAAIGIGAFLAVFGAGWVLLNYL